MNALRREDVLACLLESNSPSKRAQVEIYTDSFLDYQEAVTILTKLAKGLKTEMLWASIAELLGAEGEAEGDS